MKTRASKVRSNEKAKYASLMREWGSKREERERRRPLCVAKDPGRIYMMVVERKQCLRGKLSLSLALCHNHVDYVGTILGLLQIATCAGYAASLLVISHPLLFFLGVEGSAHHAKAG